MKGFILSIFIIFMATVVHAEPPFIVEGHTFTNVNCFQKNKIVTISGRVSGGNIRGRMTIRVHVQDEKGNAFANNAIIENYDGRGQLFETKVWPGYRAKQWSVGMIQIWGNKVSSTQNEYVRNIAPGYNQQPTQYTKESNYKFYQAGKNKDSDEIPVIFSAMENVQVVIRDKETNKPVLIKNVSPHDFRTVNMRPGTYTAKIKGKFLIREQDFQVKEVGQMIDLR